jgi:hypothetical protein
MKKILLIAIFLVPGITVYSQLAPTGEYEVRINANPNFNTNDSNGCTNMVEASIYTTTTGTGGRVLYWTHPNKLRQGDATTNVFDMILPPISVNQQMRRLVLYAERNWSNWSGCSGRDGRREYTDISTYSTKVESEYTYEFPREGNDIIWSGQIVFHIYPKELKVHSRNPYTNTINNDFPMDDDKIELSANRGFYSQTYKWYYSFTPDVASSWIALPSQFQNQEIILISGRDLFGANTIDVLKEHANENIYFSVRPNLTVPREDEKRNIYKALQLAMKLSSPHIENVTYEMPVCHGEENAKLKIKFDRALLCNVLFDLPKDGITSENQLQSQAFGMCEKIFVSLEDNRYTETAAYINSNLEFNVENLTAGTYNIGIMGIVYYYNNSLAVIDSSFTYSMGDRHKWQIVIPERPAIVLAPPIVENVHCNGGADGSITLQVSGGTGVFNAYLKKRGGGSSDTIFNFVANQQVVFRNLYAGIYDIRIFDTNGCFIKNNAGAEVVHEITITQPAAPVKIRDFVWEEPRGYGLSDGHAQRYFGGGTKPSPVVWKDSTGAIIPNTVSAWNFEYMSSVNNIRAGKYFVTVNDANFILPAIEVNICGCYDTISDIVEQPPKLVIQIEEHHYITCYGDSDGVLIAHGTGGRPFTPNLHDNIYKYEWFEILNGQPYPLAHEADSIINNLHTGYYQVKITDKNNIAALSDIFHLAQPDTLTATSQVLQNVLCNGENTGIIRAAATGGTPPYTYLWSNNETTQEIGDLPIGGYVVYVRDARFSDNGISGHYCFAQAQAFITSPNGIQFNEQITQPTCSGYSNGSISLNVTGGEPPYTYKWDDESTQTSRLDLGAGVYTVLITDANNCKVSGVFTINNPDAVFVNLGNDITLCKNQTAEIEGNIGIAGATYSWTNQNRVIVSTLSKYEISKAGIYTLTATTSEGCIGSDEIIISQSNEEIDVDFVIATKVANNTKISAINITRLLLDNIEWILPDEAVLLERTNDGVQLLFTQNGTYVVGLVGHKGLCEKTLYKTISVVDKGDIDEDESSEPFLKRFIVVPNPSDGNFEAIIELREAADFHLVLYDMSGAVRETTPTFNAMNKTVQFNRQVIGAGTYLLKFVSRQTTSVFKVLVQ